jgi:hypothetical protein
MSYKRTNKTKSVASKKKTPTPTIKKKLSELYEENLLSYDDAMTKIKNNRYPTSTQLEFSDKKTEESRIRFYPGDCFDIDFKTAKKLIAELEQKSNSTEFVLVLNKDDYKSPAMKFEDFYIFYYKLIYK